ncbi:MAG TPA: hypothetical protein VF719_04635, partial [Abditibacteriaceae bacterium]
TLGATLESAEYIENHSKINKAGPNYFASTGHASFGLVLDSYFSKNKVRDSLKGPQEIFEFARTLHSTLKEDYFLNPQEDSDDPFESSRLDCLIANPHGIFGLYSLRSVQQYSKFYAFGSGYKFALGAMRAVYDSELSAESIARIGLEAAADFDDATGLPLEIKTIKLASGNSR